MMRRTNDFNVMTEFVAQIPQGRNRYKAPLPKTCADFWYMVVQEKSTAIIMLCNFIEQVFLEPEPYGRPQVSSLRTAFQSSKKSAPYVPLAAEESPMNFDGVIVKFKRQEQFHFPINTKVNIRVTYVEVRVPGEAPHATVHYHWQDWPDRGVPEADLAPICLLAKIRNTS
ncbi:Protein-tyrosine phosphatase [Cooperia oncophora]